MLKLLLVKMQFLWNVGHVMDIPFGVKCICNLSYLNNVLFLSLT